jgi:hypothetical protein
MLNANIIVKTFSFSNRVETAVTNAVNWLETLVMFNRKTWGSLSKCTNLMLLKFVIGFV